MRDRHRFDKANEPEPDSGVTDHYSLGKKDTALNHTDSHHVHMTDFSQ